MVAIIYVLTGVCLLSYSYFIYKLCKGWTLLKNKQVCTMSLHQPTCGVIIACHNEVENLPTLLTSLDQQSKIADEIIIIDDHSTDHTLKFLQSWANNRSHVHILSATERGKKAALRQGIHHSKSELILCTDADCLCPPQWVERVVNEYANNSFDLLVLPVTMREESKLIAQVTRLEFISLVSSGMALAALGHPIMCNGANLAFRRTTWLEKENQLHQELLSGDDVFLLHAIKEQGGVIRVLNDSQVLVTTAPTPTLSAFMRQRIRWGSKSMAYKDKESLWTAGLIFGISCVQVLLYCTIPFSALCTLCAILLLGWKWMLDSYFLAQTRHTFHMHNLLLNSVILSIFYPFYIVIAALLGCFKHSKW